MITVIVDTTTTFVDVMMKSTPWIKLLTLSHDAKLQVVMPDVILRETARHWEAEAIAAIEIANGRISGIKKSRDRLTELGIDATGLVESTPVTGEPDKATFEEGLLQKLGPLGVRFARVPAGLDLEAVLQRDLARKKPFNSAGKGFRDTLVWETTKQIVQEALRGDQVFLVTGNSTDYCDDSGAVAPELLAEVQDADGELIRVADLEELLGHPSVAPMVAGLAKTDEQLATFLALATAPPDPGSEVLPVGEVVKNAVFHSIEELVGEGVGTENEATSGIDFTALSIPSEIEDLSIDTIDPNESTLTWQTYETYQDTTFLIQAEIEVAISLVGFAYKGDSVDMETEGAVHVLDWDWNDHMAYVSTTTEARLIFQIRLEQGTGFVEDCELQGAEPLVYDDPHHQ